MRFQVQRIQTVSYWVYYEAEQVVEILAGDDPSLAEEYRNRTDERLAEYLERDYADSFDVQERISSDSEKHNDVTDDHIIVRLTR